MPKCPNCDEAVKDGWANCPHCGANLKDRHYSSDDDPLEKLTGRVNKIDEFLTEKYGGDPNADPNDPDPNDPGGEPHNRKKSAAKKKRRTLFGG